jgi:hypothetical protein
LLPQSTVPALYGEWKMRVRLGRPGPTFSLTTRETGVVPARKFEGGYPFHSGDRNIFCSGSPRTLTISPIRHENETQQYRTACWVPGPGFVDQPVYVLTLHQSFSTGEEFTFDLQTQKRATTVGETRGGGGHSVEGLPAGDHFSIGVAFGRPIDPCHPRRRGRKEAEPRCEGPRCRRISNCGKTSSRSIGESGQTSGRWLSSSESSELPVRCRPTKGGVPWALRLRP